jgi:hypothetical protein
MVIMDFIKETYSRMNLQQLRSFMLYGSDECSEDVRPYRETLQKSSEPTHRRLGELYPAGAELDKALAEFSDALTAYECVYLELGMKVGARLAYQLLLADDSPGRANLTVH